MSHYPTLDVHQPQFNPSSLSRFIEAADPHCPNQLKTANRNLNSFLDTFLEYVLNNWSEEFSALCDLPLFPMNPDVPFTLFEDPFVRVDTVASPRVTPFHASRLPQIPLREYVARLQKYLKCSVECFVIAIILLDRYHTSTHIPIETTNAYRLVLITLSLSAKLQDDRYYSNKYYAEVGGVAAAEFSALEVKFLFTIKWNTHVDKAQYEALEKRMMSHEQVIVVPSSLCGSPECAALTMNVHNNGVKSVSSLCTSPIHPSSSSRSNHHRHSFHPASSVIATTTHNSSSQVSSVTTPSVQSPTSARPPRYGFNKGPHTQSSSSVASIGYDDHHSHNHNQQPFCNPIGFPSHAHHHQQQHRMSSRQQF